MEFSLLEFLGVDDGVKTLSRSEIEAAERRQKQDFNEFQYRAHLEQEQRQRDRAEHSMTGRSNRAAHQFREQRHHYGNFWFAEGDLPPTHAVGTPKPKPGVIVHQLDPSKPPLPAGQVGVRDASYPFAIHQDVSAVAGGTPRPGEGEAEGEWAVDEEAQKEMAQGEPRPRPREIVLRPVMAPPPPKDFPLHNNSSWESPSNLRQQHDTSSGYQAQQSFNTTAGSPAVGVGPGRTLPSPLLNPGTPHSMSRPPAPSQARARTPPTGGRGAPASPVPDYSYSRPRASTPRSTRRSEAPFAEHYDADAIYDVDGPVSEFAFGGYQADRNGLPRGRYGIDYEEAQAREAQRLAEELRKQQSLQTKRQRQQLLKDQLDHLVQIKRDQKLEERELEERTVFGYSLPGVGRNMETNREKRRKARQELEDTWRKQQAERENRRRAEEDYLRRPPEDWEGMQAAFDRSRAAASSTPSAAATAARGAWLDAWHDSQDKIAREEQAAAAERQRIEAATLKPNVANYSDRILMAEQVRRHNQEAYKQELDEQVRRKQYDKKARLVENFQRDARFHRPPFVRYGDGFH
jgi:hypothetical protein